MRCNVLFGVAALDRAMHVVRWGAASAAVRDA
jgi:hypothetical protein